MTDRITPLLSQRGQAAPNGYYSRSKYPVVYNFDIGVLAPETYPYDDMAEYGARAIRERGAGCFDYFATDGSYEELTHGSRGLREQIQARAAQRDGRENDIDGVLLFNGSTYGLGLLAEAYLEPGDGVVVESLTFPWMLSFLKGSGAEIATAPLEADGIDVNEVEKRLRSFVDRGIKPKAVYVIPTFQVPTGTCLSLEKRQSLVDLAAEFGVLVIEDNTYYEVYYESPPPPTLLSLDRAGLVVQTESFSKQIAPGLRMGWVMGQPDAVAPLTALRRDLGVNRWTARVLELYLADGRLDPHLASVRQVNCAKRDATVAALDKYCSEYVTYTTPEGGIFFWLEVNDRVDMAKVHDVAAQNGVACRPGERFTEEPGGRQYLRVAFLHVSEDEIDNGIAVLGAALAEGAR